MGVRTWRLILLASGAEGGYEEAIVSLWGLLLIELV